MSLSASRTTDLLGRTTTSEERALLAVYDQLTALAGAGLAPCADANVKEALAAVAIVVTDLGLTFEHLTDVGC
ncbi:hypothetical protein [Subtercola frigoramans]|uniref:RNase P/RNase MRP subunit POP5 n=1 Tax=Subtercola frigoramans TaxID=120298 RepID=A0ABS2L7F8_9MICO|nr:hypothetical protein [Subtercola frigoramans]MBM7473033.1 RNase P/RNase MRP subunit POP5 [Subtercola frigoramans]